MIEAIVRLNGCREIEARCWRNGRAGFAAFARLEGRAVVGTRRRLVRRAIFDVRRTDGGTIIDALPLRNGRAMVEALALILLADGRSRARMRLLLPDRGPLLGVRSLLRCPMVLDARSRSIVVAAIVGERGHPEGEKAQDRNDECGCRASRHVLRGCARPVATASQKASLGFAAD